MTVGVRHELISFFGRSIQAQWVVYILVYRKRHGGVGTIDAGAAGIYQVFDPMVAAAFQNVCKADDVTIDVGQRILDGVAHSSLGGEVDYALGLVRGKGFFYGATVSQVDAQVCVVDVIGMPGQSRFFDCGVVIIVVIVNANNRVAALKQTQGESRADEAGGTGDEVGDGHRLKLTGATGMHLWL